HETSDVFERVFVRIDSDEQVGFAHLRTSRATHNDLPLAALNRDCSDIFRRCFSAVARTSGGRHLQLMRKLDALKTPLDLNAECSAVANAESAEFRTHAGL